LSLSPSLLLLQLLLSLPEVAGRASVPEGLLLLLRPPLLPAVPLDSPILPSAIPPACLHCAPQDEPDHQRELYASILNQLLMNFLMCTAGK
jgi:hypothetical protein